MSSSPNRATPLGLRLSAIAGLLFLHLPLALIFLYAFTTEDKSFQFPPPGYTTKWFQVAWSDRPDIWPPLYLSLKVAAIATVLALIFGTLAAAALSRARFFGRETISFAVILPIALPGIVTGALARVGRREGRLRHRLGLEAEVNHGLVVLGARHRPDAQHDLSIVQQQVVAL